MSRMPPINREMLDKRAESVRGMKRALRAMLADAGVDAPAKLQMIAAYHNSEMQKCGRNKDAIMHAAVAVFCCELSDEMLAEEIGE